LKKEKGPCRERRNLRKKDFFVNSTTGGGSKKQKLKSADGPCFDFAGSGKKRKEKTKPTGKAGKTGGVILEKNYTARSRRGERAESCATWLRGGGRR